MILLGPSSNTQPFVRSPPSHFGVPPHVRNVKGRVGRPQRGIAHRTASNAGNLTHAIAESLSQKIKNRKFFPGPLVGLGRILCGQRETEPKFSKMRQKVAKWL